MTSFFRNSHPWPIKPGGMYYATSVVDDPEGSRISLTSCTEDAKCIQILFMDSVHAFRSTDESTVPIVL